MANGLNKQVQVYSGDAACLSRLGTCKRLRAQVGVISHHPCLIVLVFWKMFMNDLNWQWLPQGLQRSSKNSLRRCPGFEIWDASSGEGLARLTSGNSNRTLGTVWRVRKLKNFRRRCEPDPQPSIHDGALRTVRASGAPAPTQTDDFALAWEVTDGLAPDSELKRGCLGFFLSG